MSVCLLSWFSSFLPQSKNIKHLRRFTNTKFAISVNSCLVCYELPEFTLLSPHDSYDKVQTAATLSAGGRGYRKCGADCTSTDDIDCAHQLMVILQVLKMF